MTVQDIALEKARSALASVYADVLAVTATIPKEVSQGSYQRAVKWKELAKKWRAKAEKGVPKSSDIKDLDNLATEAKQALHKIKTGDV